MVNAVWLKHSESAVTHTYFTLVQEWLLMEISSCNHTWLQSEFYRRIPSWRIPPQMQGDLFHALEDAIRHDLPPALTGKAGFTD